MNDLTRVVDTATALLSIMEAQIKSGATYDTNVILAMSRLKDAVASADIQLGRDLENLLAQTSNLTYN